MCLCHDGGGRTYQGFRVASQRIHVGPPVLYRTADISHPADPTSSQRIDHLLPPYNTHRPPGSLPPLNCATFPISTPSLTTTTLCLLGRNNTPAHAPIDIQCIVSFCFGFVFSFPLLLFRPRPSFHRRTTGGATSLSSPALATVAPHDIVAALEFVCVCACLRPVEHRKVTPLPTWPIS